LWAVGHKVEAYRSGELLAGRYWVKQSRIFLDTQPGLLPDPLAEIEKEIEPYLRLLPYRLHVPQVYSLVRQPGGRSRGDILLLESAPIYPDGGEGSQTAQTTSPATLTGQSGQLMPELGKVWKQSSALRQLNWLWQMAHLWQPLSDEGAASTLLTPPLLRVEGGLLRLLELRLEQTPPTLMQLGQAWTPLAASARPELTEFLEQLCRWLIQAQITTTEDLLALLDRGLQVCGQTQTRQIRMATRTDRGPSRQRNEDACYPVSGTDIPLTISPAPPQGLAAFSVLPLTIVCDGIGGHEGGNVASNLAIGAIQQELEQIPSNLEALAPASLIPTLARSTCLANDLISQRNDQEQRHDRQRMGTTLVMALSYGHQVYVTHVGDSRAYRITRTGCHQITVDDDVASREVRLGYALYRDALQQAASGSLVQALGMNPSNLLHPTVQRFVLDEDCIFLLCSDGLSDNDRVEEHWQTEILPILEGELDVAAVSDRLIAIANSKNGHDNVTVGLIHCRVTETQPAASQDLMAQLRLPASDLDSSSRDASREAVAKVPTSLPIGTTLAALPTSVTARTKILKPRSGSAKALRLVTRLLFLLGLLGGLVYLLGIGWKYWFGAPVTTAPTTGLPSDAASPPLPLNLPIGAFVQMSSAAAISGQNLPLPMLLVKPESLQNQGDTLTIAGTIPIGSVVQIQGKLENPEKGNSWLNLKVCSTAPLSDRSPAPAKEPLPAASPTSTSTNATPPRPLRPGETGWILESDLTAFVSQEPLRDPTLRGICRPVVSPAASIRPTAQTSPSLLPSP
jgi:serine/threonine protein phosphatase PrpC